MSDPIVLYDHQKENSLKLVDALRKYGCSLDASDTGTGKTFTALSIAFQLGMKYAVIAPKVVIPSWHQAVEDFGMDYHNPPLFIETWEKLRRGAGPIVVPEGKGSGKRRKLKWDYFSGPANNTLLIFDEVKRAKGRDTLNSKLLEASRRQGILTHMMSATPAADPLDMKALGYALGLHSNPGQQKFWGWARDYGARPGFHGGYEVPDKIKSTVMQEIHGLLIDRMARTRIKDLDMFPETLITADVYDIRPKDIKKAFAAVDEEEHILTQVLRIRQAVEKLKVNSFRDLMINAYEDGKSVVAFMNFRESLYELWRQLNQELPEGCAIVWGDQSRDEQAQHVKAFQENRVRAIVLQARAGGEGISLHDVKQEREREVFISPPDSAFDLVQMVGRTPRLGGTPSVQHIIFAANTPEEKACKRVRRKVRDIQSLTDGDLVEDLFNFGD